MSFKLHQIVPSKLPFKKANTVLVKDCISLLLHLAYIHEILHSAIRVIKSRLHGSLDLILFKTHFLEILDGGLVCSTHG